MSRPFDILEFDLSDDILEFDLAGWSVDYVLKTLFIREDGWEAAAVSRLVKALRSIDLSPSRRFISSNFSLNELLTVMLPIGGKRLKKPSSEKAGMISDS
jgi:hypothetical protein